MIAIDTNVLVRFLTGDDARQSPRAEKLLHEHEVLVTTTVLLETEWVLRGGYELGKADLLETLRKVVGLPSIRLDEPERVTLALDWFAAGMDFADALHLAGALDRCDVFMTFDRQFARIAETRVAVEVAEPGA